MAQPTAVEKIDFSQHIVYICSRFLAYGLPILYFLVTTSFYLKTYDSAQIKITFTQIGTAILFMVWITKILIQGRSPFRKSDFVLVAPLLAFLASGIVSYWNSAFKAMATDETVRRIIYMILALITVTEMDSDERMKRLWRWLLAAAWVAILYGVLQYLDTRLFDAGSPGLDPFIWRRAFGPRVFSTFGNSNFYGNFLVILTPLILATVLREKGSLARPLILVPITIGLVIVVDKMNLGLFGGYDNSYSVIYGAVVIALLIAFFMCIMWKVGSSYTLPLLFVLCSMLYLNLYATETKGAWVGFMAAMGVTMFFVFEFFLHFDEVEIQPKKYVMFLATLSGLFVALVGLMFLSFVQPLLKGTLQQIGFQILWVPCVVAAVVAVVLLLWLAKKPWNLKKIVYGFLVFLILALGAGVLQFAKTRLLSVSFRLFTWISTWEMTRTNPILGHGIGTFKAIYPAYRRPQIIVLEGKSNTETDHAEDEYLEVWMDEGTVGFGIFLWLIITTVVAGFRQLRWYSKLRAPPDKGKRKKLLELEGDTRSYEVLGILSAYIGALIHWFFDVSIRFVSSGIFSGLLPGALIAYVRNHENHRPEEVRLPYDRWIRVSVALVWIVVMFILRLELVPQSMVRDGETTPGQIYFFIILAGVALYVLIELLDMGTAPERVVPFSEQYDPVPARLLPLRYAGAAAFTLFGLFVSIRFVSQFQADAHHNLAIFFSKESIWMKSPVYDSKTMTLPPDIRNKYKKWGGALEHYEQVIKKNPNFPMAHYFTGNVYNDWGSQKNGESMNAKMANDMDKAIRLREQSIEMWDKAEAAYTNTKKLMPNYVQTHHQMGLLYIKRAEQASAWGEQSKVKDYYDKALYNFRLYQMLDPVFPPNYERIIQILLMSNKVKESIELYRQAIYYSETVSIQIRSIPFPERLPSLYIGMAKLLFTDARMSAPDPFKPPLPQVREALDAFKKAAFYDPKNVEAWKGIGFIEDKLGNGAKAQEAWQKAHALSPNDPDLKVGPR